MGAYLSVANKDKESGDGANGSLKYGVSAMQGWRIGMEDAHSAILDFDDSTSFFAVYDGHGGKAVARFCASHLHKVLLASDSYKKGDLDQALKATFLRMDEILVLNENREELAALAQGLNFPSEKSNVLRVVEDIGTDSDASKLQSVTTDTTPNTENGDTQVSTDIKEAVAPDSDGEAVEQHADEEYIPKENSVQSEATTAGCTAVVAVIKDGQLVVANAGDSRCVLSYRGKAVEMSKDHKPELKEEKDRIEKARGFVEYGRVNGSLALSRAIGDLEYKKTAYMGPTEQMVTALPEIQTRKLDEGDEFVILACDGIWDVMSSQDAVDFVRERLLKYPNRKISVTVEEMFEQCIAPNSDGNGLGMDNMSAVIIVLNPIKN